MGACDFFTSARGKSMSDAYKNAVDLATSEYGTDPYNGTISTTHGFVDQTIELNTIRRNHPNDDEGLKKAIWEWQDLALENVQKWDPCWGAHIGDGKFIFTGIASE